MKKALQILLLVAVTMMLFGCQSTSESSNVLRVGATPVPHVELLNQDLEDLWSDEGRERWPELDVLNAQMQQGKQDTDRLLFVPT